MKQIDQMVQTDESNPNVVLYAKILVSFVIKYFKDMEKIQLNIRTWILELKNIAKKPPTQEFLQQMAKLLEDKQPYKDGDMLYQT